MCGILGLLDKTPVSELPFRPPLNTMSHRSPDDQGMESLRQPGGETVRLGRNRLSMLDFPPRARLPISDVDRRNWIVYNGEAAIS